jgi:hypothetical protein
MFQLSSHGCTDALRAGIYDDFVAFDTDKIGHQDRETFRYGNYIIILN